MVIADAAMQRRELPAAAGKNLESGAKRLWSASPWGLLLDAKRLWSASPWGLFLDAKRLWSAEIHLRFQLAHDSYTAMCVNRGHDRLESGAEVGFAAPPGYALQGGRAIFWCDAGEQGKTGKADAALLRFSVAVKVMAAATRLPPETKIRVAYF